MASVWLRLVDVTVAEPPRSLTGFLHHERSAAYGRMPSVTHPVYVVRHGQSEWNVRRLTQGQTPHPPLTELGRRQSAAAAALIAADLQDLGQRSGSADRRHDHGARHQLAAHGRCFDVDSPSEGDELG